jgi:uncharacterized membrane protein
MTKIFFMFFTGLITTMFGVGGVENSLTDTELLQALAVSVTGLGIMWCSTLMMQQENDRG